MMLPRSWCDMHSGQHRTTQAKGTCSKAYLLPKSRYQISHPCFISWRAFQNVATFQIFGQLLCRIPYRSALRSTSSQHVYRTSIRWFCCLRIGVWSSSPGFRSWGQLARKLQATHRWGSSRPYNAWGAPGLTTLGGLGYSSLGVSHRSFRLVRTLGRRLMRMLWGNVENSLRRKDSKRTRKQKCFHLPVSYS